MHFLHPPRPSKAFSTRSKLFVLFTTVTAAALLIFSIFYPIVRGDSRPSIYLLQCCLAIALLEKSWWHYRIRQRFLVLLEASVATVSGNAESNNSRPDSRECEFDFCGKMEPTAYAVTTFTNRYMKTVRCAVVVFALLALSSVAAVGMTIAMSTEDDVIICATVGCFAGVLCACFAPTPGDGVAILVHEGALTVTAINSVRVRHTGFKVHMAILNPLYVTLACWVVIVISRIIVSKKQLECFLMVALDTVALLHVTIVMMEIVEFLEYPRAVNHPRELSAFFVTIACAELGHYLYDAVTIEWLPRCFYRWRLTSSRSYKATDFIVSVMFGTAGILIWMKGVFNLRLGPGSIVALLGAAALSQIGRAFMTLTYEAAMTLPWYHTTFTIWNNGITELMNPFLMGWVVFHPYAKTILAG